jgi:hypothetical protein
MFWSKKRLQPFRVADPLILGGSYHKGLAHYFATDDMTDAVFVAEADYRQRYEEQSAFVLPEELPMIERHVQWMINSLTEFAKHYERGEIRVLQPEVEFTVPLPHTHHHDRFFHQIIHPNMPYQECPSHQWEIWNKYQTSKEPTSAPDACWQPHYFRGKTDAVVAWQGRTWLFEHKTEARTGDTYFTKFLLDSQPTGYIYGIRESTGLRPAGFVLNIIKKPNAQYKGDPLAVIGFEREVYIRSDADLDRFSRELSVLADDFEAAFFDDSKVYMNTRSCINWNRKCDFHDVCMNHGEYSPDQFQTRPEWDYVELEYYKILGLPAPEKPLVQIK